MLGAAAVTAPPPAPSGPSAVSVARDTPKASLESALVLHISRTPQLDSVKKLAVEVGSRKSYYSLCGAFARTIAHAEDTLGTPEDKENEQWLPRLQASSSPITAPTAGTSSSRTSTRSCASR